MHIGIFGGSFDPPHISHKSIVDNCVKRKIVDEVWVLPASYHLQKDNIASFEQRIQMCKLLFEKPFGRVKVKDFERFNPSGATYHMALILKEMFPRNCFSIMIGRDCADNIRTWFEYQNLTKNFSFIVYEREKYCPNMSTWYLVQPHRLIHTNECKHSSTHVRKLLKENEIDEATKIVGPKVIKYIQEQKIPYIPTDIPKPVEKWMDGVIKEQKI